MNPTIRNLILLFLLISNSAFSQDNASRVQEIKTMYSELTELQKAIDHKQCKKGKKTTYESFDSNSEKYPFEQTAEKCTLTKSYSILTGNFSGYEWSDKTIFYYKNNELFFVYAEQAAESCYSEYSIYYNTKGGIIKVLEKSNDCNGELPTKNVELTDAAAQKHILDRVNEDLNEVMEMLK